MSDMVWMILSAADLTALIVGVGYLLYRVDQEIRKEHEG